MKASRKQAALNRENALDVGSRLLREHGYDGIGVADLMRQAGQTHGAFYGQFGSKEAFIAEASARGFDQMLQHWQQAGEQASQGDPARLLEGLVDTYLSCAHRDNPGQGCVTAALGADAARQGPQVRAEMSRGIEGVVGLLGAAAPGSSGLSDEQKRRHALATVASLVGALTIARAVDDPALSAEMLEVVRSRLRSAG